MSGSGGDAGFAAQTSGTLLHADHAQGEGVGRVGLLHASAVIEDLQDGPVLVLLEANGDIASVRVARDVGQCFLQDTE